MFSLQNEEKTREKLWAVGALKSINFFALCPWFMLMTSSSLLIYLFDFFLKPTLMTLLYLPNKKKSS